MDYAKTILFNRQDLLRALRRRLSERLKPYADALNLLFADLFRGRLPVDWRERWRAFVAQQAALGYVTDPWSVRDMERFIFEWARFCELLPVEEMRTAYAPADRSRAAMRHADDEKNTTQPKRDPGESNFDRHLAEAAAAVNELSTILDSLAVKIDYAPINTPKDVQTEVDRIDASIRTYDESLERARETWLREGLSSATYQRLLTLKAPLHLGLPAFTDDAQRQRAAEQQQRIDARLGRANPPLPGSAQLSGVDAAECLVCTTLGGGVDVLAYQREGKWRVSKLLALSSGRLTPEERRQLEMPAPTSHHGVKLAAVVVSFILARKHSTLGTAIQQPIALGIGAPGYVLAGLQAAGTLLLAAAPGGRLPKSEGRWLGAEGNSIWELTEPIELDDGTKVTQVPFRNGMPVFDKWSKGDVYIAITGDHEFDKQEAKRVWKETKGVTIPPDYTFHHDGLTARAIAP